MSTFTDDRKMAKKITFFPVRFLRKMFTRSNCDWNWQVFRQHEFARDSIFCPSTKTKKFTGRKYKINSGFLVKVENHFRPQVKPKFNNKMRFFKKTIMSSTSKQTLLTQNCSFTCTFNKIHKCILSTFKTIKKTLIWIFFCSKTSNIQKHYVQANAFQYFIYCFKNWSWKLHRTRHFLTKTIRKLPKRYLISILKMQEKWTNGLFLHKYVRF